MTASPAEPVSGADRRSTTGMPQVDGHHAGLDGVRAVAAVMVLVFHVAMETGAALAAGVPGALAATLELAVPLFFTLSGVLLYRPWARATLGGTLAPDVRSYLWRRGVRVFPAYWVVALVALLLWSREYLDSARTWVEVLTLTFIYNPDPWWHGTGPAGLGQIWSLCTEVAFYATLPLLAALLHRFAIRGGTDVGVRARRLLAGLAVLTALSFAALALQFYPEHRPQVYLWLPRALGLFAVGMAMAVVSEWAWREAGTDGPVRRFCRTLATAPATCWMVALGAYLVCATPLTGPRFVGVNDIWTAVAHTATSIVFAAFFVAPIAFQPAAPDRPRSPWSGGGEWLRTIMRGRIMRFLARISYGIFLWQFVVLYLWREFTGQEPFTGSFWLDIGPVLGGTVLLATASYHWVEAPARRLNGLVPRAHP